MTVKSSLFTVFRAGIISNKNSFSTTMPVLKISYIDMGFMYVFIYSFRGKINI